MSYLLAKHPFISQRFTVERLLKLLGSKALSRRDRTFTDCLLDLALEFQRVFAPNRKWQADVIASLLQRSLSGVLTFRSLEPNRKRGLFQVIDGICRLTALHNFFHGSLRTPMGLTMRYGAMSLDVGDMTWKELCTKYGHDVRRYIMSITVGVDVFDRSMTDPEAAKKFRELNHGNPLTYQEIRQAHIGVIGTIIRCLSRTGGQYPLLPIFNDRQPGGMALKRDRMNYDEMMAKSIQYVLWTLTDKTRGLYAGYCNREALDNLYVGALQSVDYPATAHRCMKVAAGVWDIVYKIINAAPHARIYTKKEPQVMMLFILVLQLRKKYGATIQFDYAKFSLNLWSALNYLTDKSNYTTQELKAHGGKGKKTPYVYLLGRVSPEELRLKFRMIMEQMPKDPKKMGLCIIGTGEFSREDIRRKCDEQGGRCAGCGCHISEATTHGDHIHPRRLGGTNDYKNLQALCAACNTSKGKKTMAQWNAWKKKQEMQAHRASQLVAV